MKIPLSMKLFLWIAAVWGLCATMAHYDIFPDLHWLPFTFFAAGAFIWIERPLVAAGFSPTVETGIATLCTLMFGLHLAWITIAPRLAAEEIARKPCAPKSLELQCYTFSKENCSAVWDRFEQDCRDEVKRTILAKRSTALTGPIVKRCIYKKLDQSFRTNRRTPLNPECESFFSGLDAPSID